MFADVIPNYALDAMQHPLPLVLEYNIFVDSYTWVNSSLHTITQSPSHLIMLEIFLTM